METISADGSRTASPSPTSAGPGEWPVVPPVPTPTPPPPADPGPEPMLRASITTGPAPASTPLFPRVPMRPGNRVALRTRRPPRPTVVRRTESVVWPRRFAWITAAVMLVAFTVVTLPLWLALYRTAGSAQTPVGDVLALSMTLLGALLSAVVAWVVMVEMRARVGMVEALGEVGAYEAPGSADTALLGPLRPLVGIPAQLGLLAIALSLFVGATVVGLG